MNLQQEICAALKVCNETFRPPPKQTVAEWTPKNIFMSTKTGDPYDGPYIPFSYQHEILNCAADPAITDITLMTSAQVAKTSSLLIMGLWRIQNRPGGMLFVRETKEAIKYMSNSRFTPMVECSPTLGDYIAPQEYKSTKNTVLYKDTKGGFVRFVTAGTPGDLSSSPASTILADEIDKYENTKEGDPIELAKERMKRQLMPLLITACTPTIAGESRIEARFNMSDKRRFYVSCIHCGFEQILLFDNIKWESEKFDNVKESMKRFYEDGRHFIESTHHKDKLHFPDTAHYVCKECGCVINDFEKNLMVKNGRWIAERPFNGHVGFWINELYSPMTSFRDIVVSFLNKKDDPEMRQVFVNGTLGEVWKLPCEAMQQDSLFARREHYYESVVNADTNAMTKPILPRGGAILTAGVDVHPDRIEVVVRLWGSGYESWGIEYHVFHGDPTQEIIWLKLRSLLHKYYEHPSGIKLRIQKCAIDSGYATEHVFNFVERIKWPTVAIMGRGGEGHPLWKSGKAERKVPYFLIGVDTAKNTLWQRSYIERPGPGYMHWNHNFSEIYFDQLTNERRISKKTATGLKYVWDLPPGKNNEALDCEVYAYAALHLVGIPDYEYAIKQITDPVKEAPVEYRREPNPFTDDL
jgi:phage terminase large subunit GpA-like protein